MNRLEEAGEELPGAGMLELETMQPEAAQESFEEGIEGEAEEEERGLRS